MTTHSPSTAALTPAGSLFEMSHKIPRIRRVSNAEAISNLTDGFVAVQDATRTVFVEGKSDPAFYRLVWQKLVETIPETDSRILSPFPGINFIFGQGRQTVQELVPQLRRAGFTNFFGIIDKDRNNSPADGVFLLQRYAMEHYLYDPLNIWACLHQIGKAPNPGGSMQTFVARSIRALPSSSLQSIVDSIDEVLSPQFPEAKGVARRLVVYSAELELSYPEWCFSSTKSALKDAVGRMLHQFKVEQLLETYEEINMIPNDLVHLIRHIQGGESSASIVVLSIRLLSKEPSLCQPTEPAEGRAGTQ